MVNRKQTAIIFLFLFFKTGLLSQDIFVKGLILSEDSTPVQYATIYDGSLKSGTFSDSLGRYSISIPSDVQELHISAIGYKNKTITIDQSDNLSKFNIVLLKDTFSLNEVVISAKQLKLQQIKLGPRKKIEGSIRFCSQFNREIGLYIPNNEQIQGYIKSADVYLKKESTEAKRLVRFRIYSVDEGLYPAEDLLLDNILLQVKKSKRDQLIKIDLEKYNIPIPLNGIVVSLELFQDTQEPPPHRLNTQDIKADKCTKIETVLVDDNTNRYIQWDRIDKGKWHNIDFIDLYRQHGIKPRTLVPYFKLTINEYTDQR